MNAADRYLKFVQWSEADKQYVGYCPDLFPWGGVCNGVNEEATYHQLAKLVREEVEELTKAVKSLPEPTIRPDAWRGIGMRTALRMINQKRWQFTEELESRLLETVDKPTTPLTRRDFDSIRNVKTPFKRPSKRPQDSEK